MVDKRMDEVLQLIREKPHNKAKLATIQNFAQYLLPTAGLRVEDATPWHVMSWLSWRDTHGRGKTIVHLLTCQFIGSATNAHCACPRRLKATYIAGLVSRLRSAYRDLGDRWEHRWAFSAGNPADSRAVDDYIHAVNTEQKAAGVTVSQASVMLLPKLRLLLFAMRSRLQVKGLPTMQFLLIVRDAAWFLLAFWSGIRGRQLGDTLLFHVRWDEVGRNIFIKCCAGKTIRDLSSAESFIIPSRDDDRDVCPVRSMRMYMRAAGSILPSSEASGYLFPQYECSQGVVRVVPGPISDGAINRRLEHYLRLYQMDAGETLHGFRSGAVLTRRFEGYSQEEAAAAIGWRTPSIGIHYAKFEEVLRHSGMTLAGIAALSVDAQSVLYMRTNALLGAAGAGPLSF